MLSVIRIALKWPIGLLCDYVITTTGVTQAHHIRHQSEGCVVIMVMIYRWFPVKVLHSHYDDSNLDLSRILQDGLFTSISKSAYFSVVYFPGRPQPFPHMHRKVRRNALF